MLKVLKIGSGVPDGSFTEIFSSHTKAVNFIHKRISLSLCNRELCPGPYRILLALDDVSCITSFSKDAEMIMINGRACDIATAKIYSLPALGRNIREDTIKKRLAACVKFFKQTLCESSVPFLLQSPESRLSGFDLALSKSYKRGLQHIKQGAYSEGLRSFKGKGYGLSPGGDDFLAGFVLALAYQARITKKDLSEILDLLLFESLSENHLSNTFLIQAHALEPNEDWAEFLRALESGKNDPLAAMSRILANGHTSGYDTLSGFFAAWEMI